jgi:hypothetical protein
VNDFETVRRALDRIEAELKEWRGYEGDAYTKTLEAEVERLQAALERIANPPQDKPGPLRQVLSQPYEDARDIARAALAKEEA